MHLVKRNRTTAVVLTEDEYQRLTAGHAPIRPAVTAVQSLLAQPATGIRSKTEIHEALAEERAW